MSRWAAPKAHSIAMRSMEVFRISRWAAPKAHSIAMRSAKDTE